MHAFSLFTNHIQTRVQGVNQLAGLVLPAGKLADHANILADLGNRSRLERDHADVGLEHARRAFDGFVTDGADVAQLLGEDEIRLQFPQSDLIEIVN